MDPIILAGILGGVIGGVFSLITAWVVYLYNKKIEHKKSISRYLQLRKNAYAEFMSLMDGAPYREIRIKAVKAFAYGSDTIRIELNRIFTQNYEYHETIDPSVIRNLTDMMADEIVRNAHYWDQALEYNNIDKREAPKHWWQLWK